MALSNWAQMCFGTDGKPATEFHVGNSSIQPYKNWLYIRDTDIWKNKKGFCEPIIAQISSGNANICGFNIESIKDKKGTLFFYVESWQKDGADYYPVHFCGVLCNGYMSSLEWVKLHAPEDYEKIKQYDNDKYEINEFSECGGGEPNQHGVIIDDGHCYEHIYFDCPEPDLDELWVGVTEKMKTDFFVWLKQTAPNKYFMSIDEMKVLNQGNIFFGVDQEKPIIGELIKKLV